MSIIEGSLGATEAFMSTSAWMRDRPEVPRPVEIARAGDCVVLVHPGPAFCEPPCADGFCESPGTCISWPSWLDAGAITVSGLKEPLEFEPHALGFYQPVSVGDDLFDEGDPIVAAAPGNTAPAFRLETTGVPALETTVTHLVLDEAADTEVIWTPEQRGRIRVMLLVGHHGAPYEAMLLCETADDGRLSISGGLIGLLPRPTSQLKQHGSGIARFQRAVAETTAGPIELVVANQVAIDFSRSGN